MKKLLGFSLTALILGASPVLAKVAFAERVAAHSGALASGCGMIETAQISIAFNGVEQDAAVIKAKFDEKIKEIEQTMKTLGLDKVEMQSMSYNINPQNYGNASSLFQYNGSVSFTVVPANKGADLMSALSKKGYQPSLNVNAYRNGNVPCTPTATDK